MWLFNFIVIVFYDKEITINDIKSFHREKIFKSKKVFALKIEEWMVWRNILCDQFFCNFIHSGNLADICVDFGKKLSHELKVSLTGINQFDEV